MTMASSYVWCIGKTERVTSFSLKLTDSHAALAQDIRFLSDSMTHLLEPVVPVLEKYLDIKGQEDKRILKHVFLNSYFQTGLKGNIDVAIINRAQKEGIKEISNNYKKIDDSWFHILTASTRA